MSNAQVHRFRDKVAAYLGDGRTVYLTQAEARQLGAAFIACADDIGAREFAKSEFRTVTVALSQEA